ncbi:MULTISPECIES: DoxX family protein [unclassified Streptomyces]|uniref:DoxX family protein n=1 Tax=unclassified Streptomyces TaxID=2593676 RepID=UPI000A8E7802|nr:MULTISPECIES: DoxX family protein [unclassified Streptomyces]WRZ13058.1 DoxX family protein [Streptomyces sp. NBC_00341]WSJ24012.1 DoxX family protein [Streptomyces sp. NBC_01324]
MLFVLYTVVTVVTAAVNTMSAVLDFRRYEPILVNMEKAGVPASSLFKLGMLKAAGAAGLLVGFAVPLIGTAAAVGLALFFVGAIAVHLRARDHGYWLPGIFLLLAVGSLVLGVAHRGAW